MSKRWLADDNKGLHYPWYFGDYHIPVWECASTKYYQLGLSKHRGWATILILWRVYVLFSYKKNPKVMIKTLSTWNVCVCVIFLFVSLRFLCTHAANSMHIVWWPFYIMLKNMINLWNLEDHSGLYLWRTSNTYWPNNLYTWIHLGATASTLPAKSINLKTL